jgi:hypothetical protein
MLVETTRHSITADFLATLDRTALIGMLQNRTDLLVTASRLNLKDADYLEELKDDVNKLQQEIFERDGEAKGV